MIRVEGFALGDEVDGMKRRRFCDGTSAVLCLERVKSFQQSTKDFAWCAACGHDQVELDH